MESGRGFPTDLRDRASCRTAGRGGVVGGATGVAATLSFQLRYEIAPATGLTAEVT
jgi:hypothetical protein